MRVKFLPLILYTILFLQWGANMGVHQTQSLYWRANMGGRGVHSIELNSSNTNILVETHVVVLLEPNTPRLFHVLGVIEKWILEGLSRAKSFHC